MWMWLLLAVADWAAVEQLVARGEYRAAQEQLSRLPQDTARWHVLASRIADGNNDPASAARAAEAALRLDPRSEAAHLQLGGIFLSRNTPEAALDIFTEAQNVLPQSQLIRLGRGLAFKELQRWEEAETTLRACLPHPLAYDALATILIQRGRFADARTLADEFRMAAPKDHRGWYFLAAALDGLNETGVETAVRRALELEPRFAAAHALYGKWLLRQEQWQHAATELEQAARLRPDLVQAHLHLAQAYQKLGRADDAAREFQTVRALKEQEKIPRQRLLYHRGAQ
ncbi:MAG TPA: tetratricopeptide repeat protein [Bryobacteraceae bacterium]|nr:tetratricopeptide repeat protein [Bryobacteraceae bacterium]